MKGIIAFIVCMFALLVGPFTVTPQEHREKGRHYGYPIEAFVADVERGIHTTEQAPGILRGIIVLELHHRQYVPCSACIGRDGWMIVKATRC